ncbi:major facilitator superfamily domain-containing protein [Mycena alexandri]|uniref:Major facilitator superfamily domain-containing protein n=1 Tax=Mycena alexandri TaxID=1745969 RepID=A0AAD6SMI3_9AGAR|nr:major facilitator superfamily domain-containing protein [Mycena alexandri]
MPRAPDEHTVPNHPTGSNFPEERITSTFPEGGFQAWATVAGAFIVLFCGFGYTSSFGVYQDFYTREYLSESSASAISWVGSVNALLLIAFGLITGRFYDRGYFYHLLYGGSLLLSFSLFMLSFCNLPGPIFLVQGLSAGLGTGMTYLPSLTVVSHYFQKCRALAMTIVSSGAGLGSVVHPIMLNNMFKSLGFATAVRASAGLVSTLLLVACMMMRSRLPPSATHLPFSKSLRRFAYDKAYVLATAGLTTYVVRYYFPLFYLQLDAIQHGINQNLAFYSLVIMNSASVVGRLAPGLFTRRFEIIDMAVVASGFGATLILSMIALKTVASVVIIAVLYGFFSGVCEGSVKLLMLAVLTEDLGELGLRIGVAFTFVGIGGLIGPPIDGALLTDKFMWWRPALFSAIMAFVGVAFFVATLIVVKRRNAEKLKALDGEKTAVEAK